VSVLTFCVVAYDGPGAFRLKGVEFPPGKEVRVPADIAGMMKRPATLPPGGTVRIVSGEPVDAARISGALKAQIRADADRRELYPSDPARALDGLPVLSEAGRKLLGAKDAAEQVKAGKADAELTTLAFAAKMTGAEAVATACCERVEALKPRG
jgi:hypothetical protein